MTRKFIVAEAMYMNYGDLTPLPKLVSLFDAGGIGIGNQTVQFIVVLERDSLHFFLHVTG